MIIRKETPADYNAINDVTIEAFKSVQVSRKTEQYIIKALREADALTLSLVAEHDGRVAGHVAFSPVVISDGTTDWYGVGPLSVLPEYQNQGTGKALMNEGLRLLKEINAGGCALVGYPEYYKRFGFKNNPELIHEGIPQEVFLVLPFGSTVPHGKVEFHEAYAAEM